MPLKQLFPAFARIGLLSFGGPAGQIALMHRVLVEEKGWLDEKRFLHALNFCMLLPGPEAMQLATYAGWLKGGVAGGLMAGTLFVLPGFLVLLALSMVYAALGDVPAIAAMLFGLKAAVLAIVVQALFKVGRRALKGRAALAAAVVAFLSLFMFGLPFPLVVLGAAVAGALAPAAFGAAAGEASPDDGRRPWRQLAMTIAAGLMLWALPLAVLAIWPGRGHVFAHQAAFFSQTAVITFGGAYAVLAWVAQQAVEAHGWLGPDEMLTGLGLAETTPGPLILVLVFVGFMGAFRDAGGLDPFLAGALGAGVTLWFTFVPCFLWILAGAPFMERLRGVRHLAGALAAITAAVVGVIANLSLWFALHVLFAQTSQLELGAIVMQAPVAASFDWRAGLVAAAAGLALWRGAGLALVIPGALAAGLALTLTQA